MGTRGASIVGFVIIASVLTTVLTESPPVVDFGKPPPRCPENEVYRCQNTCPGDGCINLYAAIDCIANQTCVSDCYCKQGYFRIGRGGPCVPQDQCPPVECVSDSNARRGCGDKCGKTCGDYNSNPICPKRPCKNDGCDCKDGYIHDTNLNKCVLPKDCTKPCKSHERWSPCLAGECVAKTCEDLGKPLACPAIANPCPGGCICDYGFVRAKNGTCMDAKKCPRCGGDANAEYGCGNPCGKTCASLGMNKSERGCPQYCEVNGCDCREGYLLNTDVKPPKCVLIKNCPKPPKKCGNNEEFYCGPSCPDSEASCSNRNPPICINKKCELKCFCKKGYVRNADNLCIPADECPPKKCGNNEEFYCGPSCPDSEASCSNRNPPICINKKCELKCFCKKGYVRNADNLCIPADECPIECTKKHEKYIDCLAGQCLPKNCDDLGKSLSCPRIRGPCPGGCICEEGYLRHKGKCIKIEDCPPVCKDPNASWTDCRAICPGTCLNPNPICMSKRACSPGCQCKKGYVLDDRKICVRIGKCPVKTTTVPPTTVTTPAPNRCPKPHEHWIECIDGQCKPKTCAQLITPAPCPRMRPPCPGGCICDDGYLWDAKGNCIKEENCPKTCKGENEEYTDCVNSQCTPITCKDVVKMPACPSPRPNGKPDCRGGCKCKNGYVRSNNGTCIAIKHCQNVCKDPNASWKDCRDACPATCQNTKPNCVNIRCSPGCQCNEGYVLSKEGPDQKCVKIETCPDYAECPANQTLVPCTHRCPQVMCPTSDLTILCKPPRDCPGGCGCKPYYRYNADGNCIKSFDCPPVECTRPNEEFKCKHVGDWENCDERHNSPPFWAGHPDDCEPKCTCVSGYYKNPEGNCVLADECPPIN